MTKLVVADTGPLIALAVVGHLASLPKLFTDIYAPDEVIAEALRNPKKPGAQAISQALADGWLQQRTVLPSALLSALIATPKIDRGEAETLALAAHLGARAIVDEREGRRAATRHGIPVSGSASVLINLKQAGHVSQVKPLIYQLLAHGYRYSPRLISDILTRCGEA